MRSARLWLLIVTLLFLPAPEAGANKAKQTDPITDYVQRVQQANTLQSGPGSLWAGQGGLGDLATDYKSRRVGDLIVVRIATQTTAENSGSVSGTRAFNADSGLSALAGRVNLNNYQQLFSPHSNSSLAGKGQASTTSTLLTSLSGQIVAILPNGTMVVEARREQLMNNERQTIVVRGLARRGDVAPDNSILSTALSNLEVELKGKGVISDANRPPNRLTRLILWLVGF